MNNTTDNSEPLVSSGWLATPRTDAAEEAARKDWERMRECDWPSFPASDYDLPRELERENNRLRAAIREAIAEARTLDANTDPLVDGILSPALANNRI